MFETSYFASQGFKKMITNYISHIADLVRQCQRFEPRRWGWLIASLTTLPALLDLLISDRSRPFGYLASDAFYYLTVARNWAQTGLSTFDGELLTNGYHPLWQWALTALYWLNERLGYSEASLLTTVNVICVLLVGAGLKWSVDAITLKSRATATYLLCLALPVGLFSLLCAPFWLYLGQAGVESQSGIEGGRPLFGTAWIYMNGMESGLVLVCYGSLLWRAASERLTRGTRAQWLTGLTLALLTLSRLDHGLISGWLWLGCLTQLCLEDRVSAPQREPSKMRGALTLSLSFLTPIFVYLLYNHLTFGSALPLSGKLKSSFPQLTNSNIDHLARLLSAHPPAHWLPRAGRWLQMAIPLIFALAWLPSWLTFKRVGDQVALTSRPQRGQLDALLGWSALGVISLFLYNFLFVGLFHQGTWYYPVSTLFVSLVALRWVELICTGSQETPKEVSAEGQWTRGVTFSACLCAGLTLLSFLTLHRVEVREKWSTFYYEEAPKIRAHYQRDTAGALPPKLLSYDDGIVAFATGLPTLSGLGFTLDKEGADAYQRKRLLELALSRGHVLLTSLAYFNQDLIKRLPQQVNTSSPHSQRALERLLRSWPLSLSPKQVRAHRFSIDYLAEDHSALVIRVSPSKGSRP